MLAAGFATSVIVKAIAALYGVANDINSWVDGHIQDMQASDNQTIARTGKVLEGAKTGFGIGYVAPVTIIAVGQFLLGNAFAAVETAATAVTLTNPFAMTCAAVGAIYYGWNALSEEEKSDFLHKISVGLEIGIEFIKSVINFIISTSKEVLNSKNFDELEKYVRNAAASFGRKLGDVTRTLKDKTADAVDATKRKTQTMLQTTTDGAKKATERMKDALDQNGDGQLGLDDFAEVGKKFKGAVTRKPQTT